MSADLTIDMDKPCAECGKGGAVASGLCLKCVLRAMEGKPMETPIGQAVQKRFQKER